MSQIKSVKFIHVLRVEKNDDIGRWPKNFWTNMPVDLLQPASAKWRTWAQKNLTDDEHDPNDSDEEAGELRVYNRLKAEYVFETNNQEPILPENVVVRNNLPEMKHIIRSFLKIHYRKSHWSITIEL